MLFGGIIKNWRLAPNKTLYRYLMVDGGPVIKLKMLALFWLYRKDLYHLILKIPEESNNLRKE